MSDGTCSAAHPSGCIAMGRSLNAPGHSKAVCAEAFTLNTVLDVLSSSCMTRRARCAGCNTAIGVAFDMPHQNRKLMYSLQCILCMASHYQDLSPRQRLIGGFRVQQRLLHAFRRPGRGIQQLHAVAVLRLQRGGCQKRTYSLPHPVLMTPLCLLAAL